MCLLIVIIYIYESFLFLFLKSLSSRSWLRILCFIATLPEEIDFDHCLVILWIMILRMVERMVYHHWSTHLSLNNSHAMAWVLALWSAMWRAWNDFIFQGKTNPRNIIMVANCMIDSPKVLKAKCNINGDFSYPWSSKR